MWAIKHINTNCINVSHGEIVSTQHGAEFTTQAYIMAFNAKTYRINRWARDAYKTVECARREKASPFCDAKRVRFLVRLARFEMRCHLIARGNAVPAYPIGA